MQVEQVTWTTAGGWQRDATLTGAQLVLVFGERATVSNPGVFNGLSARWLRAAQSDDDGDDSFGTMT